MYAKNEVCGSIRRPSRIRQMARCPDRLISRRVSHLDGVTKRSAVIEARHAIRAILDKPDRSAGIGQEIARVMRKLACDLADESVTRDPADRGLLVSAV